MIDWRFISGKAAARFRRSNKPKHIQWKNIPAPQYELGEFQQLVNESGSIRYSHINYGFTEEDLKKEMKD